MNKEQASEILRTIELAGRRVLPMHEFLAETNPRTLAAYNEFLNAAIYEDDALDEAHKELVLACVCVAAGSSQPVIENHCRRALKAGIDKKALLQALTIAAAVMATKSMGSGITALMEAAKE